MCKGSNNSARDSDQMYRQAEVSDFPKHTEALGEVESGSGALASLRNWEVCEEEIERDVDWVELPSSYCSINSTVFSS